jgi:Dolichyl-phosphate-mannose-protein mannosyltransferase
MTLVDMIETTAPLTSPSTTETPPAPLAEHCASEPDSGPEAAPSALAVWAWTLGLATAALALRVPFGSARLYHWDSVQFALALKQFDVRLHQPHPPGYFYYVTAAGWATAWTGDAGRGMMLLSILFGALAVGALYRLGRELAGDAAGRVVGLLALTAPLFLFYSAVALTYSVDLFWVTLTALFCYRLFRGADGWGNILGAAAALGIAGGVRPTTLLFLAPMALLAAWGARRRPGRLATAAAVVGVLTAGWLVPTVALSGDWDGYLGALRDEQHVLRDTAFWHAGGDALRAALRQHLRCLIAILGAALVPVLFEAFTDRRWLVTRARDRSAAEPAAGAPLGRDRAPAAFLLVWGLPSALFYLAVHFISPGYAMTYAGPLLIAAGASVARVCGRVRVRWAGAVVVVVLALANLGLFAYGDRIMGSRLGHGALYLAEIRSHDEYWRRFPEVACGIAPPGHLMILTSPTFTEGLRVAQFYLSEYHGDIRQPALIDARTPLPYPVRQGALPLITPAEALADPRPKLCVIRTDLDVAFFQQLFGPAVRITREQGITVGRITGGGRGDEPAQPHAGEGTRAPSEEGKTRQP